MRIGSIVWLTNHSTAADINDFMAVVKGQDGNGLTVKSLGSETEKTVQVGEFHRIHDKEFETAIQKLYGIEKGEHLPNPNKPKYTSPIGSALGTIDVDEEDESGIEEEEEADELCESCDGPLNEDGECQNPGCENYPG